MKKIFTLLILIVLGVCLFGACDAVRAADTSSTATAGKAAKHSATFVTPTSSPVRAIADSPPDAAFSTQRVSVQSLGVVTDIARTRGNLLPAMALRTTPGWQTSIYSPPESSLNALSKALSFNQRAREKI